MAETQSLFLQLKKVEKHFINPQTDPFLQGNRRPAGEGQALMNNPTAENIAEAKGAESRPFCPPVIFSHDRLLTLLITIWKGISERLATRLNKS